MSIEEKLARLAECGLRLRDEFGISDLVASWGQEALDKPGYDIALVCLGMSHEEPPWKPHCDNLWHFDTECIYEDGSYAQIARRMAEMAGGSLPLAEIEDHVDVERQEAWLRFKCNGHVFQIDCEVNDDWADMGIFEHFVRLLSACDSNKIFIYQDFGDQSPILGCVTREQYQKLLKIIPTVQPLS